jgi:hypothetical protein
MSEVITRAILKEELEIAFKDFERRYDQKLDQKLDQKIDQKLEKLEQKIDHKFATFRELIRADMQSAVRMALADSERNVRLALEPTRDLPERVTKLEQADLVGRVNRLEAKVFPPKRASRRR